MRWVTRANWSMVIAGLLAAMLIGTLPGAGRAADDAAKPEAKVEKPKVRKAKPKAGQKPPAKPAVKATVKSAKTVKAVVSAEVKLAEKPPHQAAPQGSHEQTAILPVGDEQGPQVTLLSFCLDRQGNILAGMGGTEPGEIRVLDPDGKRLRCLNTPVKPEAIGVGPDGTLYVAGEGQLVKLDAGGRLLLQKESPHVAALKADAARLREQVIEQHKQQAEMITQQIKLIETQTEQRKKEIDTLTAKGEDKLTDAEKQQLANLKKTQEIFQRSLESYRKFAEQQGGQALTEEQIKQQVESMIAYRKRLAAISATGGDVFVTTGAAQGYGFDVWRTDAQFGNAKRIVSDLRGCCGQMDVQAGADGVFVAENARARVVRYNRDGEKLAEWGERAVRDGVEGFGSCCNPMNVAFGPGGEVYTGEATLGRVKRFSPSGQLLGLVGDVKIVPGCKKVSIAVSPDGSRVYMMDLTRTHIVLMTRKAATGTTSAKPTAAQ